MTIIIIIVIITIIVIIIIIIIIIIIVIVIIIIIIIIIITMMILPTPRLSDRSAFVRGVVSGIAFVILRTFEPAGAAFFASTWCL